MESLAYLKLKRTEKTLEAKNRYAQELLDEIEQMSKMIENPQGLLTDGSEIEKLKEEFNKKEASLKSKIEELEKNLNLTEMDKNIAYKKLGDKVKELDSIKAELEKAKASVSGIEESTYRKAVEERDKFSSICVSMENDIAGYVNVINNLKSECGEKDKEISRLQQETTNKDNEINNLSRDCEMKDNEIQELRKQIEDFDVTKTEINGEQITQKLELEEKLKKEREEKFAIIQDYETKIKNLKDQINTLKDSEVRKKGTRVGGIFGGRSL